jgi:glucose-1-phosphate thymidylyltransferase
MIKKGIILAGGTGSRLRPITFSTNKQLLPLYDKPLIYYPLSTLMLANIRNILIIVNKGMISNFKKLLSDGSDFGIKIHYKEQEKPSGIPEAFIIAKEFIKNNKVVLILGDNFYHGKGFTGLLNGAKKIKSGCCLFLKDVNKPQNYGVAVIKNNKIKKIIEKPKKYLSSKAITGIYFFDSKIVNISKNLKPSKRGETEIVDAIKKYLKSGNIDFKEIGRGSVWSDVGKIEDLFNVANYINSIEKIQGIKIGCLEEIAFNKKWINKSKLKKRIKFLGSNPYSDYLQKIL